MASRRPESGRIDARPETRSGSPSGAGPGPSWGVFVLANDVVHEWLAAMLESFARWAPELPVRLIPFDDRLDAATRLVEAYGHALHSPPELADWDRLGERLYGSDRFAARGFRKMSAFAGEFDRFLICDSDLVALAPLAPLLAAIEARRPDLVYFDVDPAQVYRPAIREARAGATPTGWGFNAGLLASRRDLLRLSDFEAAVDDLPDPWQEELVPNAEQPFVNLVCDRLEVSRAGQWELLADHCSTTWPAVGAFREEADGVVRLRDSGRWDEGWRLLFAHWAGFGPRDAELPNRDLFERYREAARRRVGI